MERTTTACGQFNPPTTDNTALECDFFMSAKCVLGNYRASFISGVEDPSLEEVIRQLDKNVVRVFRKAFNNQEVEINNLRSQIQDLRLEFSKLNVELQSLRKRVNDIE